MRLRRSRSGDTVLDVACGPGIISCFLRGRARHSPYRLRPAMLERRGRTRRAASQNLPCTSALADSRFREAISIRPSRASLSVILTRAALREMKRVAKPTALSSSAMLSRVSKPRTSFITGDSADPRNTTPHPTELRIAGGRSGLVSRSRALTTAWNGSWRLLAGSFPKPGDADRIRACSTPHSRSRRHAWVAARRKDNAFASLPHRASSPGARPA